VSIWARILRVIRGPGSSCKRCKKPLDPRVDKWRCCRACRDECIGNIKKYGCVVAALIALVVLRGLKGTNDEDTEDDDQLT